MKPSRPRPTAGLRHVALFVARYEETLHFYQELMGMALEWQPDEDNSYLCSGNDNLALHRYKGGERDPATQRLDHIGFIIDEMEEVDAWFAFLKAQGVKTLSEPRTHRDGARSFYCLDPDGNTVQIIYHPPISGQVFKRE
ncbi:VOC family protein [Litorivivens sp.]|uniref:VOC family protein n=1 Tax=Litorivivens sp. TaxID=2020868 RepID=UPI0035638312